MQIKIFTYSLMPDVQQEEELNLFLRSHKVVDVRREMGLMNGNNVWTFCVTYLADNGVVASTAKGGKIDYREVLDEPTFKVFSQLRKIRKTIADEEAVPAYAIFTDAELAELSKLEALTLEKMQSVPGIGKRKLEKYANRIITKMNNMPNETSGVSH